MGSNAGAFDGEDPVVVYEFPKNSMEVVRACVKMFRGTPVADIRVYFPVDGDELSPTRKGIAVSTRLLPELARAVDALRKAVEQ